MCHISYPPSPVATPHGVRSLVPPTIDLCRTMMLSRCVFVFNLALAAAGVCNDMSTDCGNWCAALPRKPTSPPVPNRRRLSS